MSSWSNTVLLKRCVIICSYTITALTISMEQQCLYAEPLIKWVEIWRETFANFSLQTSHVINQRQDRGHTHTQREDITLVCTNHPFNWGLYCVSSCTNLLKTKLLGWTLRQLMVPTKVLYVRQDRMLPSTPWTRTAGLRSIPIKNCKF